VLRVENPFSIAVVGQLADVVLDARDLGVAERIDLGSLQITVYSLIAYQVDAYAVIDGTVSRDALEVAVAGVVGVPAQVFCHEFTPIGSHQRPLPLFGGDANASRGGVSAAIAFRLNPVRLDGVACGCSNVVTVVFTVVEP
jgi:hypothetical protein